MARLAILAGGGALPGLLAEAGDALIVRFEGVAKQDERADITARFERLGDLFEALAAHDVTDLCMAGAMRRQAFDPARLDPVTMALVPRLVAAQGQGDDALLREVLAVFEERGFAIRGAHQVRPDLLSPLGAIAGDPAPDGDAARAREVLAALGALDVGQGAVAGRGQVLGIETLQGTDAMLRYVAQTAAGTGGVLVKRAKPGQDLRVDMPAIGPETVRLVAEAGLSGIEVQAGAVLLLGPDAVRAAAARHGIAIWGAP